MVTQFSTRWRANGPYVPSGTSKAAMLGETRQFLVTYARLQDMDSTRRELIGGGLPQRSRSTRVNIVRFIYERLVRWHPPRWVLDDLVAFARDDRTEYLTSALLLHVARQDAALYNLVQQVIVPRWHSGDRLVIRSDVQQFFDEAEATHPEIAGWSHETRAKLARNFLTILRDYGLLQGTAKKRIVEPVVPPTLAGHLVRLLHAEGLAAPEIAHHPDWRLWLWDVPRAQAAVDAVLAQERVP